MNKTFMAALLASTSLFAAEYIVKLKDNSLAAVDALKSFGETRSLDVDQFHFLETDLEISEIDNDMIEYVEPNITFFINAEPLFKDQWGLKNNGVNSGSIFFPGKKGVDIEIEKAWKRTKGKKEVKIAVIDTGVEYTHFDLKDNIMVNEAELNGKEGVDDDGNGYVDDIYGYDFANNDNDPIDEHSHGTHCAGVIGASHNKKGMAGVMANVQILPVQFLSKTGSGSLEGAIKAIEYAIVRGVDIMSNSWGGGGFTKALYEMIEKANKAGIVFVAAAGNSRSDNDKTPSYPASYDNANVISVGAIDGRGSKASFSNWGKNSVDVFAPGVATLSAVINGEFKKFSGTSMATPHVSGIIGLMLSEDDSLTPKEILAKVLESTRFKDGLKNYARSGVLSAAMALD